MDIYLDNAATTQVCPEAVQAAVRAMTQEYGNPSSTHRAGRTARAILDTARAHVAAGLGCSPREVFFTSGGSESDNWALLEGAALQRRKGRHILSSAAEHEAVLRPLEKLRDEGWDVTFLRPDATGAVPVSAVEAALREDTVLVSLMLVNNETGAVTDLAGISRLLRARGSAALLHTDAVQGYLKLPFTPRGLGVDLLSISGHKIHAPKGIGALYVRQGVKLPAHILGGGQEGGLRSGTEPMPQIAAFGEAARVGKLAMEEALPRMAALRQYCADTVQAAIPQAQVLGGGAPHILSLSLPGYRSEVLMNYLEARGIFVSKSSACRRGGRSHVLEAMGLPSRVIDGTLRISFSRYSTQEDAKALCHALLDAHRELLHN